MEIFNLQKESHWKDLALYQAGKFKRCPNCLLQRNYIISEGDYRLKKQSQIGNVDIWACNSCNTVYLLEEEN